MGRPPAQTRRISAQTGKAEIAQGRRSAPRRQHDDGKAGDRPGKGRERIHEAPDNERRQVEEVLPAPGRAAIAPAGGFEAFPRSPAGAKKKKPVETQGTATKHFTLGSQTVR